VITGDVAHTKTQISPEFVQMCTNFFKSLLKIAPVVLVPGNHDTNLGNSDRLDALTPVVEAIGDRHLYYFKESGVYPLKEICAFANFPNLQDLRFVVFSCLDSEEKWPTEKDAAKLHAGIVNIGLYHGMLQGVQLQNGAIVEDSQYSIKYFLDKSDYLMLGDVHQNQICDGSYRAAYPGSYPQQNYGETAEKGYLLWDIRGKDDHDVDFIQLPNVCPFYTIHFDGNIDSLKTLKLQPKARIRILSDRLTITEKNKVREEINRLYNPKELKIIDDCNADQQDVKLSSAGIKIENLADVGIQEKLIRHFFSIDPVDEKIMQKIFDINKKYNAHIRSQEDVLRNVQYRLGKMKWSNIGPFGENNEIDFAKYRGILGIFGKNAVGKSSLAVDIPSYCIFNRVSKNVTKNDLLINENKTSCSAEIEIFVGKETHKICRSTNVYLKSGKTDGDPVFQGKTNVDYKVIHESGRVESRNGLERSDTDNEYIRKDFGTVEDFMDTSVSPQWQLLNFINKGPTERQRLIGRYFDVDIFEKKHELAKKQLKEYKAQLAIYEKRDLAQEEEHCVEDVERNNKRLEELKKEKAILESQEKDLEAKMELFRSEIVNISAISTLSEKDIKAKRLSVASNLGKLYVRRKEARESLKQKNAFNISLLREQKAAWVNVRELEDRAASLEKGCHCKHEESCTHFAKIKQYKNLAQMKRDLLDTPEREVDILLEKYEKIKIDHSDYDLMIGQGHEMLKSLQRDLKSVVKNKEQLIKNAESSKLLAMTKETQKVIRNELRQVIQFLESRYTKQGVLEQKMSEIKEDLASAAVLRQEYDAYERYARAMSKDGISRMIISENVGLINKEIEKILSQGVEFTVELESSENGKAVEIYFKHPKSHKRVIELCSGMEKTLAAIAIRAALVNITTLPKSNIFVIDEAFDSLDSEYMASLVSILEHLKQQFDTVIVITHIDSFKDVVDYTIEIERDDAGYSKLCV
jgi:DNA repair exonuclease SbcCD ATPase subunit